MIDIAILRENPTLVKENMKKHIPTSPFLIGTELVGDKITNAVHKSWREENVQISLI